jgi:hypothetical protein
MESSFPPGIRFTARGGGRYYAPHRVTGAVSPGEVMQLIHTDLQLETCRGFVTLQNARGDYFAPGDIARWLRLLRYECNAEKADLGVCGFNRESIEAALSTAASLDMRLSLRSGCSSAPPPVEWLRDAGLLDVCLILHATKPGDALDAWLDACSAAGLSVRMQWLAPWPEVENSAAWAEKGVVSVNLGVSLSRERRLSEDDAREAVERLVRLATALNDAGIEVNCGGISPAALPEAYRAHLVNGGARLRDHQEYLPDSIAWMKRLVLRSIARARTLLLIRDNDRPSRLNKVDNLVFQYLLHRRERLLDAVLFLHKLTRFSRPYNRLPAELPMPDAAAQAEAERCAWNQTFPGIPWEDAPAPKNRARMRYFDDVDVDRLALSEGHAALATEVAQLVANCPHDAEAGPEQCHAANGHTEAMPGSLRWFGGAAVEKVSTPVGTLDAPATVSVVFGGGHAQYIGFAIGQHIRLLCPMDAPSHRLVLHVAADGHYVLLRDGAPIEPTRFVGRRYAPRRLPTRFEPALSLWNIDGTIVTQTPLLWHGAATESSRGKVRYSFITVNMRYARRLQASLCSVASQVGVEPASMEIIVAYAPGIDACDDVLDSVQAAYPDLRVIRAPFHEREQHAKGFLINRCVDMATGEWVVLLDADTLVPPDFLQRLDAMGDTPFVAPDGRKMLDREATARILLGLTNPAESWGVLRDGPGEWRQTESQGAAVGYCQCVRRTCFERVRYPEYRHFEGADYTFALDMEAAFGPVRRLEGMPVLHLDHGFSQWYGTQKHF